MTAQVINFADAKKALIKQRIEAICGTVAAADPEFEQWLLAQQDQTIEAIFTPSGIEWNPDT